MRTGESVTQLRPAARRFVISSPKVPSLTCKEEAVYTDTDAAS
jgi:hypothetical protein